MPLLFLPVLSLFDLRSGSYCAATPTVTHVRVTFAVAPNTGNMDVTLQAFQITCFHKKR